MNFVVGFSDNAFAIKIFSIAGKNSPANKEWYEDTSKIGFEECDIGGIAKITANSFPHTIRVY